MTAARSARTDPPAPPKPGRDHEEPTGGRVWRKMGESDGEGDRTGEGLATGHARPEQALSQALCESGYGVRSWWRRLQRESVAYTVSSWGSEGTNSEAAASSLVCCFHSFLIDTSSLSGEMFK